MRKLSLKEFRFPNGLTLIHLHTQNDPISACHLFLPGGTNRETDKNAGITFLMWSMLTKGTDHRNARQIAEDIESIGASIGAGTTHDYSEISCHAVSDYFVPALDIMGEMLFRPAFAASEVEKERAALMAGIRSKKESIFTVANEQLNKNLYGAHSYARPSSGTEGSVASLQRSDILQWHKKTFIPDQAIFVVASNLKFEQVKHETARLFGPRIWKKSGEKVRKPVYTTPFKTAKNIALKEKFEQAYLLIGFAAPPISSKDYVPLKILNACLGGGMSARLFQQLREQEGLAYDVGAFYASKKLGSAFVTYMGLQPSRLEEAKKRIHAVLQDVLSRPIPEKELSETKNYIKGTYILDHQTNSQRAHYLGWWKMLGLGTQFDSTYIKQIDRVTSRELHRVAKKVLGGKSITVEITPIKIKNPNPSPFRERVG